MPISSALFIGFVSLDSGDKGTVAEVGVEVSTRVLVDEDLDSKTDPCKPVRVGVDIGEGGHDSTSLLIETSSKHVVGDSEESSSAELESLSAFKSVSI